MQIRFLEIAQIELDDSIDYYNSAADGLGDEFLAEVLHALDRIKNFPQAWHLFTDITRRCQLHRLLTESYTRYLIQRFLSLQLRICIGTPTIGKIE